MTAPEAGVLGTAYALLQALGLLAAGRAVMEARTAQGAAAWAVALIAFPLLALPLFLVFGQNRFADYVAARRAALSEFRPAQQRMQADLGRRRLLTATRYTRDVPFERLAKLPFTGGNSATLLVDGAATFDSIFAGVAAARDYVLVQFYILRDDRVGRELQARLLERAAAGVRVLLLPDRSDNSLVNLSGWSYLEALEQAGVAMYRYEAGFMHQKVTLTDDDWCTVGTANFDNRSFRLNFEVTMAVLDRRLAAQVHAMLQHDFRQARRMRSADLRAQPLWFRFAVSGAPVRPRAVGRSRAGKTLNAVAASRSSPGSACR